MKAYTTRATSTEQGPQSRPRIAEIARDESPRLHIGIDEVLAMRVACWSAPVYCRTSVPETNKHTAR